MEIIPRNFGKYIIFKSDKKGQPTICLGPNYLMFLAGFLTTFLVTIVTVTSSSHLLSGTPGLIMKIGLVLTSLLYLWTGLKNPGIHSTQNPEA
jgi:hypothetical protein